jgi:hypothetical protein
MKRHTISWIPGDHPGTHNDCDCDLLVEFPEFQNIMKSILQKRFRGRRRSVAEMYAEVKASVVAQFYMGENGIKTRPEFCSAIYLDYLREFHTSKSQIAIEPVIHIKNDVEVNDSPLSEKWKGVHIIAERRYWENVLPLVNDISENLFHEDGFPKLQSLCRKKISWVDTVYGKYQGKKRIIHTKEYFPLEKSLLLYSEFNNDTATRTPQDMCVFKYVYNALSNLLVQMHSQENYGKLRLDYDPKKLITQVRLFTSGGIMPGRSRCAKWCDGPCRIVATGQKIHLMESSMRYLHRVLASIRRDDNFVCRVSNNIIKVKDQFYYGQWKTSQELEAMKLKAREFFIPDLPHSYESILVNEKRMLLERNNIIRIGMTYWWGGAYYLYTYLNGSLPNMIYVDGDIVGLDKHISDWLLLLYCSNVYPYYDWNSMDAEESRFTMRLLEHWCTNVAYKAVCHVGGFWRYMMGVMYSGGKETSHGGSWIMAFIFYCYLEWIKERNPHMSDIIDMMISESYISIAVYGDDHIWSCPNVLRSFMNHQTWKVFLRDYFHGFAR